jgi:hypothetical protein
VTIKRIPMACLLLLALLLVPSHPVSLAGENDKQLTGLVSAVVGNAGNHGTSSTQWLRATLGQPQPIGRSIGQNFRLEAGFWPTVLPQLLSAVGEQLPMIHGFKQIYPNPFNPSITISYGVADPARVSLVIYDLKGQRVRVLIQEHSPPGWYKAVWNGRNDLGRPMSSGVYFCRLVIGNFKEVKKMTLLQ